MDWHGGAVVTGGGFECDMVCMRLLGKRESIARLGENYKVEMAKLQNELQNKPLQGSCT
jgi:hypothetical protein